MAKRYVGDLQLLLHTNRKPYLTNSMVPFSNPLAWDLGLHFWKPLDWAPPISGMVKLGTSNIKYDTQVDNGKYTESHTALQAFSLMVRKISLSVITPANPNQAKPNLAEMHRSRGDNVQEILGTKRGLGSPAQPGFLSPIEDILSNF